MKLPITISKPTLSAPSVSSSSVSVPSVPSISVPKVSVPSSSSTGGGGVSSAAASSSAAMESLANLKPTVTIGGAPAGYTNQPAPQVTVNMGVVGDPEAAARSIVDVLNRSYGRGALGAESLLL